MADKPKMATVRITDDTHRGKVEGAHNGVRFSVPVDKEVQVNEGTFDALTNSGVKMTVVEPLPGADKEDQPATTAENTAIRDEAEGDEGKGNPDRDPATLSQAPDARTDSDKADLQLANVSDAKDRGTGVGAGARGLPVDNSAARTTTVARASSPAKKGAAKKG